MLVGGGEENLAASMGVTTGVVVLLGASAVRIGSDLDAAGEATSTVSLKAAVVACSLLGGGETGNSAVDMGNVIERGES